MVADMDTLSEKQLQIMAFPYTKFDMLICDGAVRSGKTTFCMIAYIDWAMNNFNNCNFILAGKTVGSCQKNIVNPYINLDYAKEKYSITYRRTDNKIIIKRGTKQNNFYIYGGKDERSQDLIQGLTAAGALLDEVALMPKSFVNQATARCSVRGAKLWFNCNPSAPQHYFYQDWILKKAKKNALHLHFVMRDNPSLDEATIKRYESLYEGVFHDRYIKGLWVSAEGAIYRIFSENKEKYYSTNATFNSINLGFDFGGNSSAHSLTATGINNARTKLAVLKAKKYKATGTSPDEVYRFFELFSGEVERRHGRIDRVYCDSAEQVIINGLRSKFPKYSFVNSIKNPVIDRIRATTSLFKEERITILKDECTDLINALESAVYKADELDDIRLDDGTTDIDSLDSFEYSFERYLYNLVRI